MVGFVWSGLCICLLLFMVLRLLCWLWIVCVSFVRYRQVEGWLPLLPEVLLPGLTGQMLADVVLRKSATAGGLDGWGWRELKVLPVAWYDHLYAWRKKVAADLCGTEVFRSGSLLDVFGSLQLLNCAHVRERDMALLRSVMVGGVWNGFLLGGVSLFLVVFVVLQMGMVTCFGNVPFLSLLLRFVKILSFLRMDKGHWPRCLLWHGWLPLLSGVNGASPWAADTSESVVHLVEVALGRYRLV